MPQYLHHHIKLHHLHYTEMNELYISLSIYAFSVGLVGIFVPIYLYSLGLSIGVMASYFIAIYLTKMVIYRPTAALAARFGPKHVLVISYFLSFGYTVLLYFLGESLWLLYPAAVMGGLAHGMFWLSRHIHTATVISSRHPTAQYSTLQIFSLVAASSAPLVGGFIASFYGIQYALLGSGLGLLVAIYPLFKTLEIVTPSKARLPLLKSAPTKHLVANFAMNLQSIVAILIWPLFIYLVVMSYEKVGIIASASLFLIVGVTWVSGWLGDRGKNTRILHIGSNLRSLVHIARGFSRTFAFALGVNVLGDVTDTLASVPYAVRYYENARSHGIAAYLVDMEIVGDISKILAWGILYVGSLALGLHAGIIITFIVAAVVTPFLRLIEEPA